MFRQGHGVWSGDPFATYEEYLHAPMPGQWPGSSSAIVTNLMGFIHGRELWLRQAFDLSQPSGVTGYVDWFVQHGESLIENTGLTAPIAERLGRRSAVTARHPPMRRSAEEEDVNVVGYLRAALGLGEAGRLMLRSLAYAGLRVSGLETSLNSVSKRIDQSCAHLLRPEANGRFQLFSINCDQMPQVVEHLRPVLRSDAYRIMTPFWELSNLPDAWLPAAAEVDEVWAPTRFIQATLVKKMEMPVIYIAAATRLPPSRQESSERISGCRSRASCFFSRSISSHLSSGKTLWPWSRPLNAPSPTDDMAR